MFHRSSPEDFAAVIRTNVLGTSQVASACAAAMRERGGGRIVLVASTAGLHGEPTVSAYAASKGAVIALGRTIAVEGAPRGVFANGWLAVKVALIVVYVVLGTLALKRARTPRARKWCYVAALLVFFAIYSTARAHHPLGVYTWWFG